MLPIYDITPFTVLDYPDNLSAIIWFSGCNYNCKYCYNQELINKTQKRKTEKDVFSFLQKRKNFLDGVVLSGGECTLYNKIYDFIKEIKKLGYLVKIDTNGSNPDLLKVLINDKLIDYVAMDFKATKNKFFQITGNKNFNFFEKSVDILLFSDIDYEFRTTLYPQIIDVEEIKNIIMYLQNKNYSKTYYVQNYKNEKNQEDMYFSYIIKNSLKQWINKSNINFDIEFRNF